MQGWLQLPTATIGRSHTQPTASCQSHASTDSAMRTSVYACCCAPAAAAAAALTQLTLLLIWSIAKVRLPIMTSENALLVSRARRV